MSDLLEFDISQEMWREYDWVIGHDGDAEIRTTYRIDFPQTLLLRPGGTTHRVVDANGVAHCVITVGQMGCVLRWDNFPNSARVNF